jgi:hypothetical protein
MLPQALGHVERPARLRCPQRRKDLRRLDFVDPAAPSGGKMSRSSRESTRSAWEPTQRAPIVSCQRRAIVSNRRSVGTTVLAVGAFGSSPAASRRRPSSRFARASARPTSG